MAALVRLTTLEIAPAGSEDRQYADVVLAVLVPLNRTAILVRVCRVLAVHAAPWLAICNDPQTVPGGRGSGISVRLGKDFKPASLGFLRRHKNAPQDGVEALAAKVFRPGEACACRSGPAGYGAGSTDATILANCEFRSKRAQEIL